MPTSPPRVPLVFAALVQVFLSGGALYSTPGDHEVAGISPSSRVPEIPNRIRMFCSYFGAVCDGKRIGNVSSITCATQP